MNNSPSFGTTIPCELQPHELKGKAKGVRTGWQADPKGTHEKIMVEKNGKEIPRFVKLTKARLLELNSMNSMEEQEEKQDPEEENVGVRAGTSAAGSEAAALRAQAIEKRLRSMKPPL